MEDGLQAGTPVSEDQHVLWHILEEHLSEASFLLEMWERALFSNDYTPEELSSLIESRLTAHLDGLAVGGKVVVEELLLPALIEAEEPETTTIAALLILYTCDETLRNHVFETFRDADPSRQGAMAVAFKLWSDDRASSMYLDQLPSATKEEELALWLEILTWQNVSPGAKLAQYLKSSSVALRSAAIKSAGRFYPAELEQYIKQHMSSPNPLLQQAAIETQLIQGDFDGWVKCLELAGAADCPIRGYYLLLVALLGSRDDHRIIQAALGDASHVEGALFALGFTGSLESARLCIPHLSSDNARTAKLAAEAMDGILGFDQHNDHFQIDEQESSKEDDDDESFPFSEDDLDADLIQDGTDDLPLPNPETIVTWWEEHQGRFSPKTRYVAGIPLSPKTFGEILRKAPLRRRHPFALELMIRTKARYFVDTMTFLSQQSKDLDRLMSLSEWDFVNFRHLDNW